MRLPLFWRLFLPAFALLAIFAIASDYAGRRAVRQAILAEAEESLLVSARGWQARLIAGAQPAALAAEARQLHEDRLTIIRNDGTVLADSEGEAENMENHAQRPEVRAALAHSPDASGGGNYATDTRRSATTGGEYLYLALPRKTGAQPLVRLARPLPALDALARDADAALRRGLLVTLLAALGLSALLSWPLSRGLAQLRVAAEAIAAGTSAPRLPQGGGREIQAVADAMAAMAEQIRAEIGSRQHLADERRAILDAIGEAVLGLDQNNRVVYANPAAGDLHRRLGLSAPDSAASYGSVFSHPHLVELLRRPPAATTLIVEREAPPLFKLEAFTSPTADGGRLLILRDLSEPERLRRAKSDLTANASHELKTPLAAILGALETLEDESLEIAQRRNFLALALRQARRLRDLLGDLLTLARLEQPGLVPEWSPLDAKNLLEDAVTAVRPLADATGVAILIEAGGTLVGDRRQLHQVLVNYLTNAIRHCPHGEGVTACAASDGRSARLIVSDRGPGVPDAIKARVFERFFRGDGGRDRESGGTGLGLAIVKHVAELHGGRAFVRDRDGGGAEFVLEWPQPGEPE